MGESIAISVEEYKKLLEASVRIEVFSDFVKRSDYSVSKEECERHLGIGIRKQED